MVTPQWLDAQYNNRARVPGFQHHLDAWVQQSIAARQQPCVLDMAYGAHPGERLDVFPAHSRSGKAPVMVFIHGGYWRSLDKSDHSFVAPAFTQQGVCVVVLNYALCPQVNIPEITMQMVRALAWVHECIEGHGGDPGNITVVGHSAGGHLAAMLLACDWGRWRAGLPAGLVRKAVSLSGLFDLEPIRKTPFLQPSLRLTPSQVRKASPIRLREPTGGRLLAWVGALESEEFIRQNRLIAAHWPCGAVPVCETVAGCHHFSILEALTEGGHGVHERTLALIRT